MPLFQKFLLLEERQTNPPALQNGEVHGKGPLAEGGDEDYSIRIENLSAKWNPNYDENTLTDINLKVKPGQLVAIIGHVGSGKV